MSVLLGPASIPSERDRLRGMLGILVRRTGPGAGGGFRDRELSDILAKARVVAVGDVGPFDDREGMPADNKRGVSEASSGESTVRVMAGVDMPVELPPEGGLRGVMALKKVALSGVNGSGSTSTSCNVPYPLARLLIPADRGMPK